MEKQRRWADYLAYLAVRFAVMVLGVFSIESSRRMMRRLGGLWFDGPYAFSNTSNRLLRRLGEHRRRAEEHLRLSFRDLPQRQIEALARASMEHLAMLAIEVLLTPRLITTWTWARYIKLRGLDEAIRVLLDRKGCIMLTGHYGNWELLGYTLAKLGFEIVAVMRPLDNEYLNRYLLDRRERSGLRLLYKKGASRSAGEVLESGGTLCFIADQNAGHKGLFVDFFGRKASTYKSIGLLAMEHNVPIIVGCARRTSHRFEYEICVNRIIRPEEWAHRDDPLLWITQEYSTAMEQLIRVAPEQYLWIHRRWKTRPKDDFAEPAGRTAAGPTLQVQTHFQT